MKATTCIMLCLFMVMIPLSLPAQQQHKKITIRGTVLDATLSPISGAIVMIDGHKTNAVTTAQGTFSIKVKPDAERIGIFTFGSGIMEEDIAGRTRIDFNFSTRYINFNALEDQQRDVTIAAGTEQVNTGYNKTARRDLTTSVVTANGTGDRRTYTSIYQMLQELPGVQVTGSGVVIQGSRNLYGPVPALIVVDGVPVSDIPNISPATVESVEVLKGTAAAIYGSRGYGGAVLITTKKSEAENH
jgi:TonB-dependent SusC/RagA subfamily outer membrane receptor